MAVKQLENGHYYKWIIGSIKEEGSWNLLGEMDEILDGKTRKFIQDPKDDRANVGWFEGCKKQNNESGWNWSSNIYNFEEVTVNKYKIGDKVVAFQKTTIYKDFLKSCEWKIAKEKNEAFLYINKIANNKEDYYILSYNRDGIGDFFVEEDFNLYNENTMLTSSKLNVISTNLSTSKSYYDLFGFSVLPVLPLQAFPNNFKIRFNTEEGSKEGLLKKQINLNYESEKSLNNPKKSKINFKQTN